MTASSSLPSPVDVSGTSFLDTSIRIWPSDDQGVAQSAPCRLFPYTPEWPSLLELVEVSSAAPKAHSDTESKVVSTYRTYTLTVTGRSSTFFGLAPNSDFSIQNTGFSYVGE